MINAIEFATANKARLGIDIINLSLGHPIYESAATDPLVQAVEAAVRAGIVVVVSAGNHGVSPSTELPAYAGILSPGNAPSAITVGAAKTFDTNIRSDDRVAPYSSRGPSWYDATAKPDLIAPGHGLVSAAAKASTLYQNNPALQVGESVLAAQRDEHGRRGRDWDRRPHARSQSHRVFVTTPSDAKYGQGAS